MPIRTAWISMILGRYPFSMNTAAYQQLVERNSYRWAEVERIGREPASQYTGPGTSTVELSGRLHPHYRGGVFQIPLMRREAARGTPLIMISGLGLNLGKWVILSVSENRSVLFSDGAPRQIDFDLSLRAYGQDRAA